MLQGQRDKTRDIILQNISQSVYFTIGYATAVALAKVRPFRCPCPSPLSLLEDPPELCRWHQHLHPPHHRKPQAYVTE